MISLKNFSTFLIWRFSPILCQLVHSKSSCPIQTTRKPCMLWRMRLVKNSFAFFFFSWDECRTMFDVELSWSWNQSQRTFVTCFPMSSRNEHSANKCFDVELSSRDDRASRHFDSHRGHTGIFDDNWCLTFRTIITGKWRAYFIEIKSLCVRIIFTLSHSSSQHDRKRMNTYPRTRLVSYMFMQTRWIF